MIYGATAQMESGGSASGSDWGGRGDFRRGSHLFDVVPGGDPALVEAENGLSAAG